MAGQQSDVLLEPGEQLLPAPALGRHRLLDLAGDLLDPGRHDRLVERLASGEVTVEGAWTDAGTPGDLVQGRVQTALLEDLVGDLDQPLAVALRVGSHPDLLSGYRGLRGPQVNSSLRRSIQMHC